MTNDCFQCRDKMIQTRHGKNTYILVSKFTKYRFERKLSYVLHKFSNICMANKCQGQSGFTMTGIFVEHHLKASMNCDRYTYEQQSILDFFQSIPIRLNLLFRKNKNNFSHTNLLTFPVVSPTFG